MLSIVEPTLRVSAVLERCAPGPKINEVLEIGPQLQDSEAEYAASMQRRDIWQFASARPGISSETANTVSWAYDTKLSSKRGDARPIYDHLRLSAPDGKCPTCMVRDSAALDHYLPRESHPALAIQPSNLIPICTACNLIKLAIIASSPEDQFLHPYYDDLGTDEWLFAQVLELPTAPTKFYIVRSPSWSDLLYARVACHFDRFRLDTLFSTKASSLLGNHRGAFETEFRLTAPNEPEDHPMLRVSREAFKLSDSYRLRGRAPWAAAAFKAWSLSPWFCSGGWRLATAENDAHRSIPSSHIATAG